MKFRELSDDSKQKLLNLFQQGHSASSAWHSLKTDLLMEHGDNYYRIAADGYHVPSLSIVSKLFMTVRTEDYGSLSGPDMFAALDRMIVQYNEIGIGKAMYGNVGKHYYVSVCTPIMQRAHLLLPQAGQLVMVDATGGLDRQRHRLYLLITPTAVGGVPLGAIITDCETENMFSVALDGLRKCFPPIAFFGKNHPLVFLTDNDLKERSPLQKQFPNSRLLLCQFHMQKAVWAWILNRKHDIQTLHQQELYVAFKAVLSAKTVESMIESYNSLMTIEVVNIYPQYKKYIDWLWKSREDWASAFRPGLPPRGNNTTNYVEVAFRLLKDCIFERVMAFNVTQLFDYLVTRYESYMHMRIIDFVNGRYVQAFLRKMLPNSKGIKAEDICAIDEGTIFHVKSQTSDTPHTVDIIRGFCSCHEGSTGKLCKHASAVILKVDALNCSSFNVVCQTTKKLLFEVATGKALPDDFILPLTDSKPQQIPTASKSSMAQASPMEGEEQTLENSFVDDVKTLPEDRVDQFEDLINRIRSGLTLSPTVFIPAVSKMLSNASKYARTETGLITALCTFATYNGAAPAASRKGINGRRRGIKIGVQPTAVARRRSTLSRGRVMIGRPPKSSRPHLDDHDYTPFGTLPTRKRKAPHNLQSCVYSNVGLGGSKSAKM